MLVLAIHTAGPACDLALLRDGTVLSEQYEAMGRGQDARLPALAETLIKNAGVTFAQIDRFAVITGPGSFTGIRVGVAFARGLALAVDKPCVGVTSLEAALPDGQQGSAIVALPAQKRPPDVTFWTQTFRTGLATGPARETPLAELAALLNDRPHMLYGDASSLSPHFDAGIVHPAQPSARRAAQVAASLDPADREAHPTYARAPDAAPPQNKTKA
ncbi:MAG: tRNA (adenosine(37)-N6)-threonylcarbamoyltransferase complex dimerization subunit type 1 TsaB [Pseudomonadota bacterium]